MYNGARFGKSAIKLSFFGQPQEEWGKGKGGGGGGRKDSPNPLARAVFRG